jgi:asparagine synthase (glutamine-hydrolysing)
MCGITGYIAPRKLQDADMTAVLSHRGPDHSGGFSDELSGKYIFLGHTRLSIIDLSQNGNQPMLSEDGQVAIVFNGEIYNFPQLKDEHLTNKRFRSSGDTEVVLELYLKYGISFLQYLNGDFAFCIYDRRIRKAFLVRDRMGVKPLYYYHENGVFIFGSEIKSIRAAGIKPVLAEEEILNYFVFKYSPQNRTLFKGINRIAPATYLEIDIEQGKTQSHTYWKLEKDPSISNLRYEDAKHNLFELLRDSTNMRLIADVPVGNFLSGGVDSSILAYFLKERKDIVHYCARKSEADLKKEGTTSDFYYASKLAQEWDLKLLHADIGKDEANMELIRRTLFYSDDLIADGSQIPSYLLTKEASKTSRVILSGMGADELFLGYAGHMLSLLSTTITDRLPFGLSSLFYNSAAKINQGKGKFLAYRRYMHKLGKYGSYPPYKFAIFNLVGDFENSCSIYRGDKEALVKLLSDYFPSEENIFDSITQFEKENVLVKNLHYIDRMSMANSVECRVPFLDHRIVEFAYNLPRNYKLSNTGKPKKILKEAFSDKLPSYIFNRRKAGFGMPLRSIFSSQTNVDCLLDRSFFSNFNRFSMQHIQAIIENHQSGREDNSSIIYALISFQEWYKLNFTA